MKIVIIDDDNLVSLSLNTILSAQDDIEVSAVGDSVWNTDNGQDTTPVQS